MGSTRAVNVFAGVVVGVFNADTVFADFTFRALDVFTGVVVGVCDAFAVFADLALWALDSFAGIFWLWVRAWVWLVGYALAVNALAVRAVAIAAALLADRLASLGAALGLLAVFAITVLGAFVLPLGFAVTGLGIAYLARVAFLNAGIEAVAPFLARIRTLCVSALAVFAYLVVRAILVLAAFMAAFGLTWVVV